jgi:hypothetical protein
MSASSSGDGAGTSGGRTPAQAKLEATPEWPDGATRQRLPLWTLGGVLAAVAATGYLVTAWLPWVGVSGIGPQQQPYQPLLTPGDIASAFGGIKWSLISIAGVLLLPLLLRQSRSLLALLGLLAFTLWTALAVVVEPSLLIGVREGGTIALDSNLSPRSLAITSAPQTLTAYTLHLASLALAIIAVLVLIAGAIGARRGARMASVDQADISPRRTGRMPGVSLLTVGLGVWGVGTFLFPWATVNCTNLPLISSTCPGVPFGYALGYGISAYSTNFDGLFAIFAAGLLLAGGALEMLIGLWWGRISWRFCAWSAIWLLGASALAILADAGVGVVVAGHGATGLPAGAWTGANGIFAALLGLLLGWIALGLLVYRTARAPRPGAA